MKVIFDCTIDKDEVFFKGDPKLKPNEYTHEFVTDWDYKKQPLPLKGDNIRINHLVKNGKNDWVKVFRDRTWEVEKRYWEFNKSTGEWEATIFLYRGKK